MRERRIRATHFRHLNDSQELESGSALVQDVANQLSRDGKVNDASRSLFRDFVAHHERYPIPTWYEPFIASLSEDGNLLSQWRAYADNGAGYSIGMNLTVRFDTPTQLSGALLRCEYDAAAFRERVRSEFLSVADRLGQQTNIYCKTREHRTRFCKAALHALMVHSVMLIPRFKASAFREEREWRLLAFPSEEKLDATLTHFRTTRRGLVPYVEIPLAENHEQLPLIRVYLGPTQDAMAALNAAAQFLKHQGYDGHGLVRSSGIPFRS